jgi:hypothetical protein
MRLAADRDDGRIHAGVCPARQLLAALRTSQSYAPVAPTWGVNNRSVALRIPAGSKKARRIEHRPSGVDANPYLVAADGACRPLKGLTKGSIPVPRPPATATKTARMPDRIPRRLALGHRGGEGFRVPEVGARATFTAPSWPSSNRNICASPERLRTVSELENDYHLYLHEVDTEIDGAQVLGQACGSAKTGKRSTGSSRAQEDQEHQLRT